MKCKKCRKEIPDGSKFCNHCGKPTSEKKLYRRADGLYTKSITIGGKRVQFYGKTEKEVYNKIADYKEEAAKGPLFADVAKAWRAEHWKTIQPTTQMTYELFYNELSEYFKNVHINQITHKEVANYLQQLPKSYSYKSCHHRFCVLKMIFRYAVIENLIPQSPCTEVKIPKGHGSKKRRAPYSSEIEVIKENTGLTFKGVSVGILAVFLLYTGLRRGEALALTFGDVDLKANRISVNKSVYYIGNDAHLKMPKTEAGIRNIIIPDYLLPLLPKGNKNDFLFSTEPQKPLNQYYFTRAWKYWQEQTGLKLTAHQLRHGYATLLHEAGVDVKDAQKLLGHANAAITQDVYTDVSAEQIAAVEKKINAYLQ